MNKTENRINTDEMVARIGSWKDSNLEIKWRRDILKSFLSSKLSDYISLVIKKSLRFIRENYKADDKEEALSF